MKCEISITRLDSVYITATETLPQLLARSKLELLNPRIETWCTTITNRGTRQLALATFSRDMWWELEVEDIYKCLIAHKYEYAVIEDLISAALHETLGSVIRRGTVLCLGSPIIGDLEPLNQSIRGNKLWFSPFAGCTSRACSVLLTGYNKIPTPRSPQFPFVAAPKIDMNNPPFPSPSDLNRF